MRIWMLPMVLALFPLRGNAQSIQPFYMTKDIVFKPELLGKWNVEGVTLEFCDVGEKTYGINLHVESGFTFHFRARLIHIGAHYFLDGQISGMEGPEENTTDGNSW
jgi:hypothetical protein